MRSHFLRTAATCFLFLVIINYVNALPVHSQNDLVAHDHEYKEGFKKSLYGRSGGGYNMEVTSSARDGPVGDDQQTSQLNAKRQRSESPALNGEERGPSYSAFRRSKRPNISTSPPTRSQNKYAAPEAKEPEGLANSPSGPSKDGNLEANLLTMRVPIGSSKRTKLPSERQQPHTAHAGVGEDGKIVSSGGALDNAARKQARMSRLRRRSSGMQDLGKMIDIIRAGVGKENGDQAEAVPWRNKDQWPVGLVRAVIVQIFSRRERFLETETARNEGQPEDIQLKIVDINEMERSQLNNQLDSLWKWAIQRKTHIALNRGQNGARKDVEGHTFDDEKVIPSGDNHDRASLLLQSLSKSTYRMEEMPWRRPREHMKTPTWTDFETKMVLKYIWKKVPSNPKLTPKLNPPSLADQREILAGESNPESSKELQGKMDEAWALWVAFRKRTNEAQSESRARQAGIAWRKMEEGCIEKYAKFEY